MSKSIIVWERSGFISPLFNSIMCPHSVIVPCTNDCFDAGEEE